MVLLAVQRYGEALEYASKELRADRELVLLALKTDGWALQYASKELRADREVVLTAVSKCGGSLIYASLKLKNDREIVLMAVRKSSSLLQHLGQALRNDPLVVAAAIRSSGGEEGVMMGNELEERLRWLFGRMETLPRAILSDKSSILEYARTLEQSTWQKIWLVHQFVDTGIDGLGQTILKDVNLPLDLMCAREIRYCAPVIAIVNSIGWDWRSMQRRYSRSGTLVRWNTPWATSLIPH